jgi:hypothetical protein
MMAKVLPMNSTPELKYEIGLILDQLEKRGTATTKSQPAFRFFSNKTSAMREANQLWLTTGCAIEQRLGIRHVIQVNPDYLFERCDECSFKLVYRY